MVSLHIFKHQANTILLQKCRKSAVYGAYKFFFSMNRKMPENNIRLFSGGKRLLFLFIGIRIPK